jgi:hypothetical protein
MLQATARSGKARLLTVIVLLQSQQEARENAPEVSPWRPLTVWKSQVAHIRGG